jgi:hypothetical protein
LSGTAILIYKRFVVRSSLALAFVKAKAHIFGLVLGILMTPVAAMLGIISGGAGHGDYLLAKLLFPFTMLSTLALGSITPPFVLLALAQFPAYGWLVGNSVRRSRWPDALGVSLAHIVATVLNFVILNANFS